MGYAIIRNAKYKMSNLMGISKHNERQNKNYGNKDIDTSKSSLNYHLHEPKEKSYEREFYRIRDQNNLKGNLRLSGKKQSNVVCEFLITSDKYYFDKIGDAESQRYFKVAYNFACQKCGKENIISAVVHMDESTPHMHLMYIPVVTGKSKKQGEIKKINCSDFWKGFNSYGILQDEFHKFITEKGFQLERGEINEERRQHLNVREFKLKTAEEELQHAKQQASQIIDKAKATVNQNIIKMQADVKETEAKCADMVSRTRDNVNEVLERKMTLESEIEELESKLKPISDKILNINSLNRIEGKKSIIGNKIVLSPDEFQQLKESASDGIRLSHEIDKIKQTNMYYQNEYERINKNYKNEMEKINNRMYEHSQINVALGVEIQFLKSDCQELQDKLDAVIERYTRYLKENDLEQSYDNWVDKEYSNYVYKVKDDKDMDYELEI